MRVARASGLNVKTPRDLVTEVEPERGARSAAAQKERPSDERQEVLRLHMPQVGLGWPHKNAGEDTPAKAVVPTASRH